MKRSEHVYMYRFKVIYLTLLITTEIAQSELIFLS